VKGLLTERRQQRVNADFARPPEGEAGIAGAAVNEISTQGRSAKK
jgi:hypothetical protein